MNRRFWCLHGVATAALGCVFPHGVKAAAPPDAGFDTQWNLQNTGQVIASRAGTVGADIDWLPAFERHGGVATTTVAIIADGVDTHVEYADRLLPGYSNDVDPFDWRSARGVGTHVAGVLASGADNGFDLVGVAPTARLLPVRVDAYSINAADSTADALRWAVDHGARVVIVVTTLMSGSPALESAVNDALAADVVVIAPAGDDAGTESRYPAAYENCLAVTSTDHRDELDPLANHGTWIDLAAPGVDVPTTDGTTDYAVVTGTSVAAAHVAGVAALVRSYAPTASAADVIALLLSTADDLGPPGSDVNFGAGRINARRALDVVGQPSLRIDRPVPFPAPGLPFAHAPLWIDMSGTSEAESVLLHTLIPGRNPVTTPFARITGRRFASFFPTIECGATIEYYIEATGTSGSVATDPPNAPELVWSARTATLTTLFADTFETDRGWSVEAADCQNNSGCWVRVSPAGTSAQPGYDAGPNADSRCYITGQNFGGSDGLTDVDGGPFTLVSPVVDLTTDDAEVRFSAWLYTDLGTPDDLVVACSRNGGTTWAEVLRVGPTDGWARQVVRLSDFPELVGSRLRVRFTIADTPNDSLTEAGVDDFEVVAIRCNARRGDADADGLITTADVATLPDCLSGPGRFAASNDCLIFDLTIDGHVDLIDVAGLQQAIPDR